jgi:hypothetical protein
VTEARAPRAAATLAAALILAGPWQATAQTLGGPFARLFGATPDRAGREWTSLDFRGGGGAEYNDFLFHDSARPVEPGDRPSGESGGFAGVASASIQFVKRSTASELVIDGRSVFREYLDQSEPYGATTLSAGARYKGDVATRLTLEGTGSYERQPFFLILPETLYATPDWLVEVPSTPYAAFMQLNDNVYGQGGFEYRPTKRSSFSASGHGQWFRFPQYPDKDFSNVGAQALFRHHLTRDFGVHAGYGRQDYRHQVDTQRYTRRYLDLGVDYNREISIARSTQLRFATMTGIIREGDGPREFRVEGFVSLTKAFNRTWHAAVSAHRRTEFLPGIFAPAFSDTANLSLGGLVSPRLQWAVVAGGGRGSVGLESVSKFRTATAATRLGVALTRTLGTFVHYQYFYYDAVSRPIDALEQIGKSSRQSVTVGLNVWVPLYERMRVLRDPE